MIVAGVMSGTSADGIDVALVRLRNSAAGSRRKNPSSPPIEFLGHAAFPYPASVRKAVLAAMNASSASVADLARLNVLLGELYADAVLGAEKKLKIKAELVGCHGQTIYHQGEPATFLGRKLAVTWQTGEASRIAARVGVPVVSDFRAADMAVGGQGAPLVPYLDYLIYRDPRVGRVALNIGGIANVTAIPANAASSAVIAFDTGPGNMVIDALASGFFGHRFDRNGRLAAQGHAIEAALKKCLRHKFFSARPPKTAGREEFGREFVQKFRLAFGGLGKAQTGKSKSSRQLDMIATATALTARSIADALRRYVLPRNSYSEVIASGGGTRNPVLMRLLAEQLGPLGLKVRGSEEFGIPSEAKEAVAFAVMAFATWNHTPSNIPSATGARRPAVLGKVSYP